MKITITILFTSIAWLLLISFAETKQQNENQTDPWKNFFSDIKYVKDHERKYCFAYLEGRYLVNLPCDSLFYKACINCTAEK